MELNSVPSGWSINVLNTPPAPHKKKPETTPSKRKVSSEVHQVPSDARTHSAPSVLRAEQPSHESLGVPDLPVPRKRAKSASGESPGAANADKATVSPGPKTPGSCKRAADQYKRKFWQTEHINTCSDPMCRVRSSASQRTPPSDINKSSAKETQQQAEDVFKTPTKKQAATLRATSCYDVPSDNESSPSGARGELGNETFEMTEESHGETPRTEQTDDHKRADPNEAQPDQDKSNMKPAGSTYDKSPLDIHRELRAKFEQELSLRDESGYIYIMRDVNRPHLCKIGRSKYPKVRRKTIERACGLDLEIVHSRAVRFYIKTEALVQAYLSDLCEPHQCEPCGKEHNEWFEIPSDLAKAAVNKWADFMRNKSPYDPMSKRLQPCWSEWLSLHDFTFAEADVDGLRTQWDKFMSRSELDFLSFEVQSVWDIVWKFFWPVYATLAWTATFIAFRHPIVFFLMATSVIGTFVSMSHDLRVQRHVAAMPNRRRTKRG